MANINYSDLYSRGPKALDDGELASLVRGHRSLTLLPQPIL